jgi:mono/diheme cytochrome c family protein
MPYGYYTKMSRQDALTIRDYLASLDPVSNPIRANQLPFPFNVRASLIGWKALFFKPGRFQPDPTKPEAWNHGAYLVEALEHCGMCHTAKNSLGGDDQSRALQGGLLQDWYSPNLTGDPRTGLKSWTEEDLVTYLKTGTNRFTAATGPMAEAVEKSTSNLTDGDLHAIAAYLKDLPAPAASAAPAPVAAADPAMRAGQAIYVDNCAACHGPAGTGIAGLFPVLQASPSVQSTDPTNLIRIVLRGTRAAVTGFAPTAPAMPALSWKLSDGQIAAVTTYVRNAWGNAAPAVSADQVAKLRQNLARQAD